MAVLYHNTASRQALFEFFCDIFGDLCAPCSPSFSDVRHIHPVAGIVAGNLTESYIDSAGFCAILTDLLCGHQSATG
jgi:hypothetical protein